jgi:HEAT repeat protein
MNLLSWFEIDSKKLKKMETTKDIKGLSKALTYKMDADIRGEAARILGATGDKNAVKPLIEAFQNEKKHSIRCQIIKALGEINDPTGAEHIIQALNDKDRDLRKQAAETIGQIGYKKAIKSLIHNLSDPDRDVRLKAAMALEKLGWYPEVDEKEKVRFYLAKGKWTKLGELGELAIEELLQALKNEDEIVRWNAVDVIKSIKSEKAIKALVESLKDQDKDIRWKVSEGLAEAGWEPSNDEEKAYYLFAQSKLVQLLELGEGALPAIIQALKSNDENLRENMLKTLEKLGDVKLLNLLKLSLKDDIGEIYNRISEILDLELKKNEEKEENLFANNGKNGMSDKTEKDPYVLQSIEEFKQSEIDKKKESGSSGKELLFWFRDRRNLKSAIAIIMISFISGFLFCLLFFKY